MLVNQLRQPPINSGPGNPNVPNMQTGPGGGGGPRPGGPGGPGGQGGPGMVRPPGPGQPGQVREREVIWRGELEWQEKLKDSPGDQKISHSVACNVSTSKDGGVPEVRPDNWPAKLIMQLIPKSLVQTIGGQYFRNSKSVLFHPNDCESLEALTKVMGTGFAGCVHFTGNCDIKVLILLYSNDKKAYLGFIPNDQVSFVERIRTVIQQQKMGQGQQLQQQQQNGVPGPVGPGQMRQMGGGQGGQVMMPGHGGGMMAGQQQQMMGQQQQQMLGGQGGGMMAGQQRMMMGGGGGGMVGQQMIRYVVTKVCTLKLCLP